MLLSNLDEGSGPPVVLIHAGVADRRMWAAQVEALRRTHRVIAPDLRGYGETPLPPETFSFSGDVVHLLDELEVREASLVGASLGGRVAVELAAGWPSRVTSLVLLSPALGGLEPTAAAGAFDEQEEALLDSGAIDAAVELNVRTWLGPHASAQSRDLVRAMQRRAFDVQMAAEQGPEPPTQQASDPDPSAITARTLIVSGDLDMDHFRAIAEHLSTAIPAARLMRLEWAGHLPSLERPEEINRLLTGFLSGEEHDG